MKVPNHFLKAARIGAVLLLAGCGQTPPSPAPSPAPAPTPAASTESAPKRTGPAAVPAYTYEVVHTYPHDRGAFTQGLVYLDGILLESTGLNGESSLRKVNWQTGEVLKRTEVPPQYFAEGLATLNGKLFQLTWQNHKGFVYDLESFQLEKEFTYAWEGWGLATDGQQLIMSDGTDEIRFLDPATFEVKRSIRVRAGEGVVNRLNELEYIRGEIYANVWGTVFVVRIDPATGNVNGVIDFTGLLAPEDRAPNTDVLNGIAWDAKADRLFVTGKRWPKLFEVRLKPK